MQGQSAGDAGDVRPGIRMRETLEKEGLILLEHRELRVFAHAGLNLRHEGERGLTQAQATRTPKRKLPQPHSQADAVVFVALEQAGTHEVVDDPMRRR